MEQVESAAGERRGSMQIHELVKQEGVVRTLAPWISLISDSADGRSSEWDHEEDCY